MAIPTEIDSTLRKIADQQFKDNVSNSGQMYGVFTTVFSYNGTDKTAEVYMTGLDKTGEVTTSEKITVKVANGLVPSAGSKVVVMKMNNNWGNAFVGFIIP